MYDNGDILLFALSAMRKVSWSNFKRYLDEVHRSGAILGRSVIDEPATSARWQALRTLSCLGHIDLHSSTGEILVTVASPALAMLPVRVAARAVLCGARTPGTIANLEQAANTAGVEAIVKSQSGSSSFAPARVELLTSDVVRLQHVAEIAGVRYLEVPPALLLAKVSTSWKEYSQGLAWLENPELNWHREDFDIDQLRFRRPVESSPQRRLSRYRNPTTSIWHYRLWQDGKSAEVDLDWGRYTILALSSRRVLQYDMATRVACVPYGAPLPALLARAFGLCSGHCPTKDLTVQTHGIQRYYFFNDVPPSVFNAVANKLNATDQ